MLDINMIELKKFLDSTTTDISLRKKLLTLAVGFSVARATNLPSSQVDFVNDYYTDQVSSQINEKIFSFNEQLVLDTEYCGQIAKSYWMIRYNTLYPNLSIGLLSTSEYDIYCTLSGVNIQVSLDDYNFTNEYKLILITLINFLLKIIK